MTNEQENQGKFNNFTTDEIEKGIKKDKGTVNQ